MGDDAGHITSGKEILVMLRFGVPPGTDPVQAGTQLLTGGIQVSLGLHQWLRDARADVVDEVQRGPSLHRI